MGEIVHNRVGSAVHTSEYYTFGSDIPDAICQLPHRWHTRGCRAGTAVHEAKALLQWMSLDMLSYYTQFTVFWGKDTNFLRKSSFKNEKSPIFTRDESFFNGLTGMNGDFFTFSVFHFFTFSLLTFNFVDIVKN